MSGNNHGYSPKIQKRIAGKLDFVIEFITISCYNFCIEILLQKSFFVAEKGHYVRE